MLLLFCVYCIGLLYALIHSLGSITLKDLCVEVIKHKFFHIEVENWHPLRIQRDIMNEKVGKIDRKKKFDLILFYLKQTCIFIWYKFFDHWDVISLTARALVLILWN